MPLVSQCVCLGNVLSFSTAIVAEAVKASFHKTEKYIYTDHRFCQKKDTKCHTKNQTLDKGNSRATLLVLRRPGGTTNLVEEVALGSKAQWSPAPVAAPETPSGEELQLRSEQFREACRVRHTFALINFNLY